MTKYRKIAEDLIAEAEKRDEFRAGIAPVDEVLGGPSYKTAATGSWKTDHTEKIASWLPKPHTLLVLATHHPEDDPLDVDFIEATLMIATPFIRRLSDDNRFAVGKA